MPTWQGSQSRNRTVKRPVAFGGATCGELHLVAQPCTCKDRLLQMPAMTKLETQLTCIQIHLLSLRLPLVRPDFYDSFIFFLYHSGGRTCHKVWDTPLRKLLHGLSTHGASTVKIESRKAQKSCFPKSSVTYLSTLFDWQFRCIKSLRIRIPICTKLLHLECMEMYGRVCCLSFELFGSWGLDFLGHLQSQLLWGKQTTSPQWSFCTASGSLTAGDWPLGSETGNWASRAWQMQS